MAIIKHISVKNRFYSDAVKYLTCKFDEYTNKPILDEKGRIQERDSYLIDGVNCDADTFGAECIETNRLYGKNNAVKDVKAHHYIISFDPTDEITMEQAMEFGKQWLSVFAPGHQAVLAVHPDGHNGSRNMHVHRELMALQQAADEYKDNGALSTKSSTKKVEEVEADPEAEVVVSGIDVYKGYIGKKVKHKAGGTGVVAKCDGTYISIQFSTGPKAGQTINYSLEMCLKNELIELI